MCGVDNSASNLPDYTTKKYLFFTNPFNTAAAQVCVTDCPSDNKLVTAVADAICLPSIKPNTTQQLLQFQKDGKCGAYNYKSKPVLKRCAPSDFGELVKQFAIMANSTLASANLPVQVSTAVSTVLENRDIAQQIVGDFAQTWVFIAGFAGVAVILSLVWVILLRFVIGFFVWLILGLVLVCLHGLAGFLYLSWTEIKTANALVAASELTAGQVRSEQTYMGMFIAACVVAFLFDCVFIFMRKRIGIAVEIIKEASKAVKAIPTMTLFPIFTFLLTIVLIAYWGIIELFLVSAKTGPTLFGFSLTLEQFKYTQWYHLFGLLWTQQFLSGINQMVIAGAVASWYWAADKRALPSSPVWKSFKRTFGYHLGSVAVGSLLIALVQLVRIGLFYIERMLKKKETKFTKFLMTCCHCCFACIESVFKFINRNAYIQVATYGTPFFTSAKNAFQLLTRNAFRLVAIDSVAGFVLFMSKAVVTCLSGAGCYYALKFYYVNNELYYPAATVFVVMVESFAICSLFMYVYAMAVDTIFLSFCQDIEANDGSYDRPYKMSADLQKLADVKQSKPVVANSNANRVAPVSSAYMEPEQQYYAPPSQQQYSAPAQQQQSPPQKRNSVSKKR